MNRYSLVFVFRSARLGDCSNNGVSSRHDHIYVLNPKGNIKEDELPSELLFRPERRGEDYIALLHVYPPISKPAMYGGNLAASNGVAYFIHDRFD